MKTCSKCGVSQALDAFHARSSGGERRQAWCTSCMRAARTAQRAQKPEPHRAASRAWRASNGDRHRASVREWQVANPEAVRSHSRRTAHRRRARLYGASTETISAAQISALTEEFNGLCGYCSAPWEHLDHYIPLARGGSHTIDNLVPACAACNLSKGSKLPIFEWISRPDLFKEVRPFAV